VRNSTTARGIVPARFFLAADGLLGGRRVTTHGSVTEVEAVAAVRPSLL
jgi:transcriptional regulator GlxA family with amidase domain